MQKPTNEKWYNQIGEQGDCVVSTRVRLARNLRGYPFPNRMTAQQKRELCQSVRDALLGDGSALRGEFRYLCMNEISDLQAAAMVERHLISPEFAKKRDGEALILSADESISIMLCEEDHIRIQVMRAGLAVRDALDVAQKLDYLLDERLDVAFDEQLGYLTSCPTNLGTGMRASVMLHLPAIAQAGAVSQIASAVSKIGLTMRGTYGEGSRADGSLYQLSNQITLGISEQTACDNLETIAGQIIAKEREARSNTPDQLMVDQVYRALGTLRYARMLSYDELLSLTGYLRIGVGMGLLKTVDYNTVNRLIIELGRASMAEQNNSAADPAARDTLRADIVRQALGEA